LDQGYCTKTGKLYISYYMHYDLFTKCAGLRCNSWLYTHFCVFMYKYYIHGRIILTRCTHYLTSIFVLLLWKYVVMVPHHKVWSNFNTFSFTTTNYHICILIFLYTKIAKTHIYNCIMHILKQNIIWCENKILASRQLELNIIKVLMSGIVEQYLADYITL